MIPNERGQELHHRATTGQSLTPEEGKALEEWYAQLDHEENRLLAAAALRTVPPDADIQYVRDQINATLARIGVVSGKIQEVNQMNETIRQDIIRLQQQLTRQTP